MNPTTTTNTPKDAIAEGVAALIAQLEAGNSAALTSYLAAMSRFHRYSFGNVMMIARQMPDASRVAGFQAWKQLGRNVKKGEKAIRILAPMVGKKAEAEADKPAEPGRIFGFRAVCVFDISQTEGAELPEFHTVSGDASEALAMLQAFAVANDITVEFAEDLNGALGLSHGGRISLLAGASEPETAMTLAHELAHELLHKQERRTKENASTRELEAEAVAFIVGSAFGLSVGSASADYIKLYSGDADKLRESLESIKRAAGLLLACLTPVAAASSEVAA